MAISYVGGQQGGRAGATSTSAVTFALTGGTDSTPQAGDLVVISIAVGSTADRAVSVVTPSGYTSLTELYQNDTYDVNLGLSYKFMGSTPDTSFTLPSTGSTADAQRYTVHVYRGVDTSSPLDVAAVTAGGINARTVNPGAITPATSGAWIHVVGAGAGATGGTYAASYLTAFLAGTTADTNDAFMGAGYYSGWTSGAYDPAAFTGGGTSTTSDSWAAYTLALRPAPNAYSLTAQGGSYALTGAPATISRNRSLTASGGSYSFTGQQATITYAAASVNYTLTAQGGSYTWTGQTATILRNRSLTVSGGSYAYTGGNAVIERNRLLTAQGGAYALLGSQADITYVGTAVNYNLVAQGGSYTVSGSEAAISIASPAAVPPGGGGAGYPVRVKAPRGRSKFEEELYQPFRRPEPPASLQVSAGIPRPPRPISEFARALLPQPAPGKLTKATPLESEEIPEEVMLLSIW